MPDIPHRSRSDEASYRSLERAGRGQLAWEWLRRDPEYRQLAPSPRYRTAHGLTLFAPAPTACRQRWGCLYLADAHLRAPHAPMLWDPCLDLSVLRAEARAATPGEANIFDVDRWASSAVLVAGGPGDEQLLLHDGQHHQVRFHIIAGTLLEGPVGLRFDFALADRFEPALATLRRFLHLCHSGEWLSERALPDRLRRRILLALRVHDALTHGTSIREIGILLFGKARVDAEWRDPGESLKSQCRRLIALARTMARGGYKDLLR